MRYLFMLKLRILIYLLLFILVSPGCSFRENSEIPAAGAVTPAVSAVPVPSAADPAKRWRSLDLKKYPDANTILLDDIEKVAYNADGTYTRNDEFLTLICTEKGRDEHRTLALHFNEFYEKTPAVSIRIIKPDGRVIKPVLQKKISVESSQMQSNIYDPANKVLSIGIPGLEVGDILHCVLTEQAVRPRMQNVWCTIALLQTFDPVLHYSYTISAPENMPLAQIVVKDEVKGTLKKSRTKSNGRIIYTFEADNVPQIIPEPDMPPWYLHSMRILASTVPDWQTVSRWYYNLCMPHIKAVSPELTRKAKSLAAGKNEKAAIRAMFDFVSKEIRYTGVANENTAPGYEPHDVKDTFAQKHGVCRDKAALLAAMLLEAGFDAFPVLFMAGDPKDLEVPNNYFNHAITGVKTSSGELILMDPTDENSVDMLPAYAMDKSFLCATKDGDVLRRTPVVAPEKNKLVIRSCGKLDEKFQLQLRSEMTFYGINDNIYRGAFARWSADYREQFIASALKRALPGAELKKLQILPRDIRDLGKNFRLIIECTLPDAVDMQWGAGALRMPFLSRSFGALNFMLGDRLLKVRKYPLQLFSTAGVEEKLTLEIPSVLEVAALPEPSDTGTAVLKVKNSVTQNGKLLQAVQQIDLAGVTVPAADYPAFRKTLHKISRSGDNVVIVKRNFAGKDFKFKDAQSVLEKSFIRVNFDNAKSWQVHCSQQIKVLDYGAVKELSELKIPFVASVSSGKFIAGKVTDPAGKVRKVDPADVKVMDLGNSAAPRYPMRKYLIVPLPGVMPGSLVEYSWQMDFPDFPDGDFIYALWRKMPVKNGVLEIRYPAKLQRKVNLALPESGFRCETEEKSGKKIIRIYSDNIPQMPREPGTPAVEVFAPYGGISFFDAADYGERVIRAVKTAAGKSARAVLLAQNLTCKIPDLRGKVQAIRDHVAKNIRAAGPEITGIGLKYITGADVTLRENYGNSLDRAILLYAMLQGIGVKNIQLLAVSDVPYLAETVRDHIRLPRNYFSNIVLVVKDGGQEFYLNANDEYSPLEYCIYQQKIALDLATGELCNITSAPDFRNHIWHDVHIKILPGGKADFYLKSCYYGGEFAALKKLFANIMPALEKQFWDQRLSGVLASGDMVSRKRDFSNYPGVVEVTVSVEDFWKKSGDYISFILPEFGFASPVNTAGKRTLPYWFFPENMLTVSVTADLPQDWQLCEFEGSNYEIFLPDTQGSITRVSRFTPGLLEVESSCTLPPAVYVTPDAYNLLEALQKKVSGSANRTFLFKSIGK